MLVFSRWCFYDPADSFWLVRGRGGMGVTIQGDERSILLALIKLLDGRTRRNDPSKGLYGCGLPESTFSIQFIPPTSFPLTVFRARRQRPCADIVAAALAKRRLWLRFVTADLD